MMQCCCVNELCGGHLNDKLRSCCCVNMLCSYAGKHRDGGDGQSVLLVHEDGRTISDSHFVLILVLASAFSIFAGG